jgi:hypothetical protein
MGIVSVALPKTPPDILIDFYPPALLTIRRDLTVKKFAHNASYFSK